MSKSPISARLREQVRRRAELPLRCDYCQSQELVTGVQLTIDHILPESLGGVTTLDNLCLACWECNLRKGSRVSGVDEQTQREPRLFNPVTDEWDAHFVWSPDGIEIQGLTAIGRATIATLQLNRSALLHARKLWHAAGWHPPGA